MNADIAVAAGVLKSRLICNFHLLGKTLWQSKKISFMHHFGRAATSCAAVWMRAFIKNYVLTLLFLKYVSDKHKYGGGMIELHAGTTFDDIVKLKNTADIGDRLNKIIAQIAEDNDLKGVIDVTDFNDEDKLGKGKEMIDRLSRLVGIFKKLNLSSNQAEDDDLLGDAYEYLMRHFATESGKSKGQFYTPAEVSRIMAKIIGISADCPSSTSVYDPTCGSGSLLLKAAAQAGSQISLYGQEKDVATASLARMNMILHNNETAEINTGNTLSDSSFRDENDGLKTFDFAVANPPYPARKKRRLRLFAASAQKPETKRQRCDYSSARCAVSRQCRSAYSHGIA